jgi:hypothetical protein
MKRRLQEVTWDGSRKLHRTLNLPRIVCLCGSTRFYEDFQRVNYELTMKGYIVLSVGFYSHSQEQAHGEEKGCTPEQKKELDRLHLKKIDLTDWVWVINKGGYVGDSTMSEIAYATLHKKLICWMEEPLGGEARWFRENQERFGRAFLKHKSPDDYVEKEPKITLNDDIPGLGKKGDVVSADMFIGHSFAEAYERGYVEGLKED